ncbi:histone-lysine N-methyltransferase SETMAR [Trichonephila clavipes]|nr:histone-lysine N-methyltransferase SETMAR [Trichonephila clavipes]
MPKPGEIGNGIEEVIDLTIQINLEGDLGDVQEILDSHNQELTIDGLIKMHEHDQDIEELESLDPEQSKKQMTVILLLSKAFGIILSIAVHRKDSTSERRIYASGAINTLAERNVYVRQGDLRADEAWLYYYDPTLQQQSSEWKHPSSPTPKKEKTAKLVGKVRIFFYYVGIVNQHAVESSTTVNDSYHTNVLRTMVQYIKRKRLSLRNGFLLHHDNVRSHIARCVLDVSQKNTHTHNVEILPHPPYSPDLTPCDFWLFPQLKKPLRGRRFASNNAFCKGCGGGFETGLTKRTFTCFLRSGQNFEVNTLRATEVILKKPCK